MSTYNAFSTQVQACRIAIGQALPDLEREHAALVQGLNSLQLARMTSAHATVPTTEASLNQLWSTLSHGLPSTAPLATSTRAALDSARSALHQAATGAAGLENARDLIEQATSAALHDIWGIERRVVAGAAQRSLTDLGFSVERAEGTHVTALWAQRGHHAMLIEVGDGGGFATDHAGLSDSSCETVQAEVLDRMAAYGIQADEDARVRHGDRRGGELIATAARTRAASIVEGAAAEGDRRHLTATRTLFAPGSSRSSQRYERGAQ